MYACTHTHEIHNKYCYTFAMDWFSRHRYAAALSSTILLIAIGYVTVINRSAIGPTSGAGSININGVIQNTDPGALIPTTPTPTRPNTVDVPYTKIVPVENQPVIKQSSATTDFDWNSFIDSLSAGASQIAKSNTTNDAGISDAYAFIPSGLFSPPQQEPVAALTDSQKALYSWGSDVGSIIQSYENSHPNQAAILTDHMQDRDNPAKIAAMKQLGADLKNVANSIDNIGEAPPQMSTAGPALSAAYRDIGTKLAAVPDAQGDEAIVKAILTYNSAAESFAQKYVSVVLVFQANGVKFTQDEPGGVFMFPGN